MKRIEALLHQLDTSSDKAAGKVIVKFVSIGKSAVPALIKAAQMVAARALRRPMNAIHNFKVGLGLHAFELSDQYAFSDPVSLAFFAHQQHKPRRTRM